MRLIFIKTKTGDYVKITDITFIWSDSTSIYCVAGICPKICLGLYSDKNRRDEIKKDLITHITNPSDSSNKSGVYEMPDT